MPKRCAFATRISFHVGIIAKKRDKCYTRDGILLLALSIAYKYGCPVRPVIFFWAMPDLSAPFCRGESQRCSLLTTGHPVTMTPVFQWEMLLSSSRLQ